MNPHELRAYLHRIRCGIELGPNEPSLGALMQSHVERIPFENIDVFLGRGVRLERDAVFRKLVEQERGGYCFEQNSLFAEVLEAIGFRVRRLAARSRIDRGREEVPPRTHLCLEVSAEDQTWLVDVGIGAYSLLRPLRFREGLEQPAGDGLRRLILHEGRWLHQARHGDDWTDVCELTGEEMAPIDLEVANWYTSTHPNSLFKRQLMVAMAHPGGRTTLRGRQLTVRTGSEKKEVLLEDAHSLARHLERHFGLVIDPRALAGAGAVAPNAS